MTKISKKSAYPKKTPVVNDYFVGTDSEDSLKTVSFGFEETAKLINELTGTSTLNYLFKTSNNIPLEVLTEGVFLSDENETTIVEITKLYVNKNNFYDTNLSSLFQFIRTNKDKFLLTLRNSNNLNNTVYFNITAVTEFSEHFTFDVTTFLSNASLTNLVHFNIYFFDFELKAVSATVDLSGKQNQLIAGANIAIDVTNPLAPIISASGGTSKPNKVATVTLSDIGIVTTNYTKSDLETAVTAYRQTLPMDVIFDILVVKNSVVNYNFDVTSSNWGTLLTAIDWQAYFIGQGATFATITNFYLVAGRVKFNVDSDIVTLQIGETNITALNSVNIPSLQILDLYGNQLTSLAGFVPNANLQEFRINNNQITSLTGFTPNANLLVFDVSGNQITTLSGFVPNVGLQYFYVSYNQMTLQGYTDSEVTVNTWLNGTATIDFSVNIDSVIGTNLQTILISKGYTVNNR